MSEEYVFALAGGRWFLGKAETADVDAWYREDVVKMVLTEAREMYAATQPVMNRETGEMGIRKMSGVVPIAPSENPTTICIRPGAIMRGSECQRELDTMLRTAEANEVQARSGLTIAGAVPRGGMQ